MKNPYWKFWYETNERLYYKLPATKWWNALSLDGLHWVSMPLDSPEVKVPVNQAMGRFLIDVARNPNVVTEKELEHDSPE